MAGTGRSGTSPRRAGLLVAALVAVVAAALAWLAAEVDDRAHQELLQKEVEQAGALLTTQVAVLETQMADAGRVAAATGGQSGPFESIAARAVERNRGLSLSLWRAGPDGAELLAQQGGAPVLSGPGADTSFVEGVPADGRLTVAGVVTDGESEAFGYGLRLADDDAGLVVYAETRVAADRRLPESEGGPFSGLDFAIYLGTAPDGDQLIGATEPVPDGDDTAMVTVPFGDGALTLVGASPEPLTGTLSSALWAIVLGVGVALAAGSGLVVSALAGRRAVAERLAADNRRLYEEQRGIAGTLQHALLPDVPRLDGVEVAARYVAGAEELDVGGDWFDVVDRGPGCCVFVVGDITGHGLPAATTMAELRFAVRAYLAQGDDVEVVAAKLRGLLDVATGHRFATVLLGELDTRARRVRLVRAGHFPPLLAAGRTVAWLEGPVDPPIGVDVRAPSVAQSFDLPARGTLLAFTDGLVERRGEDLDEGLARLHAAAAVVDDQPLEAALDEVMAALGSDRARDDTVLLGLRWTAGGGATGQG
ncbi:PP2C family protein-serine/threonine phosphatase [Trujillonella humicola]|uniref:PP2C family protein-serine/threonine phosphatase n=1 Tax=Trujillonella humicola TaxID=3383699 RepID=UPI003905B281